MGWLGRGGEVGNIHMYKVLIGKPEGKRLIWRTVVLKVF
jgi:hypothetical protein